jgi:phosphoglycolate phosphatase-like HAD superfamily hydrolase
MPLIVLFDVDGVLLESKGHLIAARELFHDPRLKWNQENLNRIKTMEILRRFEAADTNNWKTGFWKLNNNFRDLLPGRFRRWIFIGRIAKRVRKYEMRYSNFFPGTEAMIRELARQGVLMGICSNGEGNRIKTWLQKYHLEDIIQCYTSRDDQPRYGIKPSPKPLYGLLLKIKKRYNLPKIDFSQVAFIGDNCTDILAAKNGHIKSIAVLNGHGYKEELEQLKPDFILKSVAELPLYINQIFNDTIHTN